MIAACVRIHLSMHKLSPNSYLYTSGHHAVVQTASEMILDTSHRPNTSYLDNQVTNLSQQLHGIGFLGILCPCLTFLNTSHVHHTLLAAKMTLP